VGVCCVKLDYCFHIFYWFYLLEIGAWISQAVQDDCCALFDHFCGDDDGGKASSFSTARSLIISLMITRRHGGIIRTCRGRFCVRPDVQSSSARCLASDASVQPSLVIHRVLLQLEVDSDPRLACCARAGSLFTRKVRQRWIIYDCHDK